MAELIIRQRQGFGTQISMVVFHVQGGRGLRRREGQDTKRCQGEGGTLGARSKGWIWMAVAEGREERSDDCILLSTITGRNTATTTCQLSLLKKEPIGRCFAPRYRYTPPVNCTAL